MSVRIRVTLRAYGEGAKLWKRDRSTHEAGRKL